VRGEKLTELRALQAMLIPPGDNIVSLLARWDAGSQAAFVAKMNAAAGSLGLRSTRYTDVSGADPATASTAAGRCPGRAEQLRGQVADAPPPDGHGYMFTARAQG
jgi:D-alanyl-D-alanine carboxypeptidase